MRILLVDDDEALMESLAERLIQQRYAVDIAVNGNTAQNYVDLFDYDLIVLDLMLPDGDGIQFCRVFRQEGYINPLMILTAKESTAQKVEALDAGADDYVVKPFDFDELCARIRALLRRENQGLPTVLVWGPLRLDPSTCETTYRDNPVRLTPKEFSMMELFLRHPNRVYSLSTIIEDLWSFEDPPGEDAVRTHVKGLRRKLTAVGAPKKLIKTVYGLGYRLNQSTAWPTEDAIATNPLQKNVIASSKSTQPEKSVAKSKTEQQRPRQQPDKQQSFKQQEASVESSKRELTPVPRMLALAQANSAVHQANLSQQLVQACRRYLNTASYQIATLEQLTARADSELSVFAAGSTYEEGRVCAHKLAGSLGSFGVGEGSQIAKRIETCLEKILGLKATKKASKTPDTLPDSSSADSGNIESALAAMTTQLYQHVSALRQRVDQATVQAVTAALATSVEEGLPVALIVSADSALSQSLIQCASQARLQSQAVANVQQAIAVLDLAACDLVVLDMLASRGKTDGESSDDFGDDVQTFLQQVQQNYALPTVVLGASLPLDQRLRLVRRGVEIVTERDAPPLQIMTAAARVIRAQVSDVKVAIADDDPDILALLQTSLESWGFQVITFERATSLWQWLAEASVPSESAQPRADILVLDVEMPEMSGLELCQILRADARFQSIPILFLTHHQEDALRLRAYQLGADDFIYKAIAPTELATRLHSQLQRTYTKR